MTMVEVTETLYTNQYDYNPENLFIAYGYVMITFSPIPEY
jgi:hypothetical protein